MCRFWNLLRRVKTTVEPRHTLVQDFVAHELDPTSNPNAQQMDFGLHPEDIA